MASSGNGYAEFTVPADPGYIMFGLNNSDSDQTYSEIDFAFYTYPPTGRVLIFESGSSRGAFGNYAAGDTLRIKFEDGTVKYYLNNSLLYTSSKTSALPHCVDTSLYSNGASVENAVLAGTLVDVGPNEPVVWTNDAGVSIAGNSITKTETTGWGNAGAASTRGLNGDGYAEFTVPTDPGYAMFGLSSGDTDQSYADIDFAFYTYPPTGRLMIFESGASRGTYGDYAAGDTLSIGLEAGIVKYYRNGFLLYTSSQSPALPLIVDTSLYSSGATVQNAALSGTLVSVSSNEPVVWTNDVGVSVIRKLHHQDRHQRLGECRSCLYPRSQWQRLHRVHRARRPRLRDVRPQQR